MCNYELVIISKSGCLINKCFNKLEQCKESYYKELEQKNYRTIKVVKR